MNTRIEEEKVRIEKELNSAEGQLYELRAKCAAQSQVRIFVWARAREHKL